MIGGDPTDDTRWRASEILDYAADLVDWYGLARYRYEEPSGAVCALRALHYASGMLDDGPDRLLPTEDRLAAFLAQGYMNETLRRGPMVMITEWSDSNDKATVVKGLRTAARRARKGLT